ncbi:Protein AF-17 [Linnemannia exigua]|uniref:Protein AF-17 n=1 Tax=Linnemannia exigua TaxID=604196 RepID=A0AAD4D7W2_9FUNG|nr:Protein AF-17 [Linnemannia exigua]
MSSKESSPTSVPDKTDCLVCGSGKSYPKNPILFCDGPGCDIPVHQKCYGVDVVPSGNWYCQRCEDRIPVMNTTSGAFKRTTIPNQYIHPACARFHPRLDATVDPIEFDTSLVNKQICCLCKSDAGVCSPCSADSCSRAMHVTCAQEQELMTSGKNGQIYCDVHRDTGILSKIMKSQSAERRRSASASSSAVSGRSKSAKYYGESSSQTEDDSDDEEEDVDEDVVMQEESEDDVLRGKSSTQSSATPSKGHTKNKRSLDSNGRRRRNISSGSEEIDVDDTEAVLGSSLGGATTQKRVSKSAKTSTKESAAESQRRRLLQALDKNKKKQGTGSGVFANVTNLSTMPIRTLGGIGVTTSVLGSPSGTEPKQKLPGINRNINNVNTNNTPPAFDVTAYSPINTAAANNGLNQSNGRNVKGLTFDLDPAIDASAFKANNQHSVSGAPSPIFPNYSNSGSPLQARMHERQHSSPKTEDTRELQGIIQSLQNKVATLEITIQGMTQQQQHLQQKLAASNSNRTPPSGTPTSAHTPTSSTSSTAAFIQANPHTVGPPGQDLQYKFDVLQHTHAQDKMRNLSLRENLREIFGLLQVSVGLPGMENRRGAQGEAEWSSERLDDYVQMLRDTIVGAESTSSSSLAGGSRPAMDAKRRDMIVDRVMKELSSQQP